MKKKFFLCTFPLCAVMFCFATYVGTSDVSSSSLLIDNVEALADGGDGDYYPPAQGACPSAYATYYNEKPWPWSSATTFEYCKADGSCEQRTGYSPYNVCG